jgi:hypothetical protein
LRPGSPGYEFRGWGFADLRSTRCCTASRSGACSGHGVRSRVRRLAPVRGVGRQQARPSEGSRASLGIDDAEWATERYRSQMSQSRELGIMTIAGSFGPALAGGVVSAREGSPGMCLGRRTGVAGRAPTRPVPPSDSTTPSDPSGRPMCTAQTRPASPPANDVESGDEAVGFVAPPHRQPSRHGPPARSSAEAGLSTRRRDGPRSAPRPRQLHRQAHSYDFQRRRAWDLTPPAPSSPRPPRGSRAGTGSSSRPNWGRIGKGIGRPRGKKQSGAAAAPPPPRIGAPAPGPSPPTNGAAPPGPHRDGN